MLGNTPKTTGSGKPSEFHLSKSITLFRNIDLDGGIRVSNGRTVNIRGQMHEIVEFSTKTKGILVESAIKDGAYAVTFENDQNRFLYFFPDSKRGNRFTLQSFADSPFTPAPGKTPPPAYEIPAGAFPVKYAGRQFYLVNSRDLPFLFVKNWN